MKTTLSFNFIVKKNDFQNVQESEFSSEQVELTRTLKVTATIVISYSTCCIT